MTVKQTRCPFCHSAFYITALQLNAYRGQARCGQCHQIFDANTNMVLPDNPVKPVQYGNQNGTVNTTLNPASTFIRSAPSGSTTSSASTANYGVPTKAARSGHVDHVESSEVTRFSDEAGYSEDTRFSDEVGLPAHNANQHQISAEQTNSRQTSTSPVAATQQNPVAEEPLLFSDEVGLSDDEPLVTETRSNSPILDSAFNQQFLDDTFEDLDVLRKQELGGVEKLHAGADDSWINDLLEEDNKTSHNVTTDPELKPIVVTPQPPVYTPLPENALHRPPDHDEDLLSFLNRTGAVSIPTTTAKPKHTTAPRPASHRILKPTRVESNPMYFVGWGLMSALMLALLVAQYIYFNFEHMAMDPKTSGYISKLCAMTGCQIPYMNVDELHLKNIKLVANNRLGQTTFRGQLSNSAHLSQPFPALRLSLQRDGKTVASQIIQPRQYLPDNLKTLTRLATKTPYPIEFTIKTRRSEIKKYTLQPQYH